MLTAEQVAGLWLPTEVHLSPDGSRVAWGAAPIGKPDERGEAAIFVAAVDGSTPPRRWTYGGVDLQPRWSPDGEQLAFLSDRKEHSKNGLYLMSANGGEARPFVVRKKSVEAYEWSPDGTRIAFLGVAEPDEEDERREKERDDPAVYGERQPFRRLWLVDVASGDVTQLPTGDVHVAALTWSPDGTRLAYTASATTTGVLGDGTLSTVYVCPIEGGESQRLCTAADASTVAWPSEGSRLAFAAEHERIPQAGSTVWAVDLEGGEPVVIGSQQSDPYCSTLATSAVPGERRVLVIVAGGLGTRLEWRDLGTGVVEVVTELPDNPWWVAARQTPNGPVIAYSCPTSDRTREVWAGPPGAVRRISSHGDSLDGVALASVEEFRWRTHDEWELDGILLRPPNAGNDPLPTVVIPHGGPYTRRGPSLQLENAMGWGQWLATAGYAVLMPNFRGGFGRGHTFAATVRGDICGADYGDVIAAVDVAVERGIADPDRLAICGWSGGGMLTAWAVSHTDRFKAAIVGAGVTDWAGMVRECDIPTFSATLGGDRPWDGPGPHETAVRSAISYAKNVSTPVLIVHGESDVRVPVSQGIGFHRALLDHDATVRLVTYPREGHAIAEAAHQRHLLAEVRAWITKYV
ncbi:S9 family peptidase [Tenggerimyces flavus]|uniref:Prolyl oligopeptidase family serine peptidase n=1 Tax=Tenggerimyces flavus TaxID=1708749 RepID=A0ABV7YG67_9ACTN|nr:S9 family peptidase [Tenggerimyces flavus]MBM7788084.1 dipeptidyl aminopeptidase/acylaminoacyl peptidase [Tenggerimyces flavus]